MQFPYLKSLFIFVTHVFTHIQIYTPVAPDLNKFMMETRRSNGKEVIDNWDSVFKALSAEPRRQLIVSLLDAPPDESVPLPESAVNPNVPPNAKTLRQQLHHVHLPMLADMGFVGWEKEPFVASRGPQFEEVAVVFDALQAEATSIPDSLVIGCQRLEEERQGSIDLK